MACLSLGEANLLKCLEMAKGGAGANIQDALDHMENPDYARAFSCQGNVLCQLAQDLENNHGGLVPFTKDEVTSLHGVTPNVASLLMQHVFGDTQVVFGIDACKIFVALDLFDWQECREDNKRSVKMTDINPQWINKSMDTWLPKPKQIKLQHTLGRYGCSIGVHQKGNWGMLKSKIMKHFKAEDKKTLPEMVNRITWFYIAAKKKHKPS